LLWVLVIRPLQELADRERRATQDREGQLRAQAARQDFHARLHRALEMAATEEGCYTATGRALALAAPDSSSELLLADSSQAHLTSAVGHSKDGKPPACPVVSPQGCPAVRRAQTLTFSSDEELDACPQLADRRPGGCSAVCVPVSVGGRSIGVLHTLGAAHAIPEPSTITRLETIAELAGTRIGMLRVMEKTHLQAATDPLTGLLNRRTVEDRAHELLRLRIPFALAVGDLDHFKTINDTHGHDAGDRALRLFSRTLEKTFRADDIIARPGGDEFVILFPGRSTADAADALDRVREQLVLALAAGPVPGFTATFGVSHSDDWVNFEEILRAADNALFQAKRDGRNRVAIEGLLPQGRDE
jgi:diguanylate cyclase (GGDEF)-like protein